MRALFILGFFYAAYTIYALIQMTDSWLSLQGVANLAIFIATPLAALGLWKSRAWGLYLSLVLAAAGLAFGLYLAHFVWNFWLFETQRKRVPRRL